MIASTLVETARLTGLRALGYSAWEVNFVEIAALHSGYFLRRQCEQLARATAGADPERLLDKLLANGHATASTFANHTLVYHLGARALYGAIVREDNRNRRPRQPASIKTRLMILDFVLSQPEVTFLATECQKTDFFASRFGINATQLPSKTYYARHGQKSTRRYFVDKNPMFVSQAEDASPTVTFGFVDAGATTISGFETYLAQYSKLMAALPQFKVTYIAARPKLFRGAERAFERFLQRPKPFEESSVSREDSSLDEYFQLRLLFENGQRETFNRDRLIRLRDMREQFAGTQIDQLFSRWKERRQMQPPPKQTAANHRLAGTFSTCWLEYDYDFLGNLTSF